MPMITTHIVLIKNCQCSIKRPLLIRFITFEMKIPGSPVPKGTQLWSEPPIMLRPRGPPALTSVTSWNGLKFVICVDTGLLRTFVNYDRKKFYNPYWRDTTAILIKTLLITLINVAYVNNVFNLPLLVKSFSKLGNSNVIINNVPRI